MAFPHPSRRAFTLIELLVVIAIIALLLGILIPALSKARLSAQVVKSKANLRSHGQTQFLYASDFRDSYINPFNTSWVRQGGVAAQPGWATVSKPGLGGVYHFASPNEWYSEMYAFHWYSLVGGWLNEGDYASEVQFAPADRDIIIRFGNLAIDNPEFNLNTGIWDSSYVLSPTTWFSPERYRENLRPDCNRNSGPGSLAKRNKISDTAYPSSKVIIWERFDFGQNTRTPTVPPVFNPGGPDIRFDIEQGHPQWNNTEAEPNVLTADGSVITAKIADIKAQSSDDNPRVARQYTPTDVWGMPRTILEDYGMEEDGWENGSGSFGLGVGLYPAYFWATRDGIKGRDLVR